MTVYLKATLAGIVAAVVAPILWILVRVGFGLAAADIQSNAQRDGSAGIGAVSVGFVEGDVLLAMLAGFVVAFLVVLRRSRRLRVRMPNS